MDTKQVATEYVESNLFESKGFGPLIKIVAEYGDLQRVHTPFDLCEEIVSKLVEYGLTLDDLRTNYIGVFFNLEFLSILIDKFGASSYNIDFVADSDEKEKLAKKLYNVRVRRVKYDKKKGITIMPKPKKQFDVVIMNPPYQPPVHSPGGGSKSHGNSIWDKFVEAALNGWVKTDGFLAAVHPVKWRKPDDALFKVMAGKNIHYLELHTKQDGIKTFGASTPYDWYVLQNNSANGTTTVRDTAGNVVDLDLKSVPFLPNCDLGLVEKLLAKEGEDKCEVVYNRTEYGSDKNWVQQEKDSRFKYPCIHATAKGGIRVLYSSRKGKFLNLPKIIFGQSDTIQNVVSDVGGKYGITECAIGLKVTSEKEAENLKKTLESDRFNALLQKACRWSQFRIDWRMFKYFRKDFWKEFV